MMRRRHLFALALTPWMTDVKAAPTATGRPPRLVTVHGSLTEIAFALKAQATLVGTDTTSAYPPAAQQTTKVGYMRSLSAEGLLALQPTAVLGTEEAGPAVVLAQVRAAGIPVTLAASRHRFEDVTDKIHLVAQATGRGPAGRDVAASLQRQWQTTQAQVARTTASRLARKAAAPRVLFVMAHGGAAMTAGTDTAADAVLGLVGASNALTGVRGYRALNAEAAAAAQPDVVLTTTESLAFVGGAERFWQQPGLALTPAARHQRLIALDAMGLLGFGPRMPAVLDDLRRQLA
ncbi:ABC transporter substrate-binding protein [uncultured Aquabacterium sp.]|uniref:heme/hemin ABC transporter substrate-binding protein n=1 Tax=uncultured Aquabacterium sp. TaxID=158753 RepID=UPI0026370EEF|nr:ABC transporter substrate-binding protein [uncultured Aquabacterium sp.]